MSITTVPVEFLGDERLRELSGCENLRAVNSLRFSVDTSENSLGDFGHRLPNLRQLRLDGSNVTTLRDLGTGLGGLRVLWLARSGLRELEGFGSLGALCELYLAFNEVVDLSQLQGAEQLEVLDLEGNAIADPDQVHYLSGCDELTSLTLEGNPIADDPDYRSLVLEALPRLMTLDEAPTDGSAPGELLVAGVSDSCVDDGLVGPRGLDESGLDESGDATPVAADVMRARTRELRLVRDGIKYTDALRTYDTSSLTHGDGILVCGNPARGLRQKRAVARSISSAGSCDEAGGREEGLEQLSEMMASGMASPDLRSVSRASARLADNDAVASALNALALNRLPTIKGKGAQDAEAAEFLESLYRWKLESAIAGEPGSTDASASGDAERTAEASRSDDVDEVNGPDGTEVLTLS